MRSSLVLCHEVPETPCYFMRRSNTRPYFLLDLLWVTLFWDQKYSFCYLNCFCYLTHVRNHTPKTVGTIKVITDLNRLLILEPVEYSSFLRRALYLVDARERGDEGGSGG